MKELNFDAIVVGGGAAGMAAALELETRGFSVAVLEREEELGGILMQCIHNGFGLIEFNEELSGPEFAQRFEERLRGSRVMNFCGTTVTAIETEGEAKILYCVSRARGVVRMTARAVVLAMGCRERNRGNIRIPGSRPAGVYTAGLAQRLVNIEGYIPGREIVIIGSGDIGLIMARRMSWIGCKVHAVVEILPYPSGLTRNIVQCLHDFDIPLYLSHLTTDIYGRDRVEGVEITPIENGAAMYEKARRIPCDTVLLSVGLVPENELSKKAGVEMNPMTNGPWVDASMMTTIPGVFACGNVLHVHDLVDFVVEESRRAGGFAADWLSGARSGSQLRVKAGANIRYVSPSRVDIGRDNKLFMRPMVVKNDAVLEVKVDGRVVLSRRKGHIQPSEMISLNLGRAELGAAEGAAEGAGGGSHSAHADAVVEISVR
jgi:NADPH-dependent 2,4-dienoyl-CoA reductase/sulfur reductase-like enzyme